MQILRMMERDIKIMTGITGRQRRRSWGVRGYVSRASFILLLIAVISAVCYSTHAPPRITSMAYLCLIVGAPCRLLAFVAALSAIVFLGFFLQPTGQDAAFLVAFGVVAATLSMSRQP